MKTLQIDECKAKQLYRTASDEFKATLECTFGQEFFTGSVMDRVKEYKDACAETGETPINVEEMLRLGFTKDEIAYRMMKTVTKALNEGWVGNVYNSKEYRYYPVFYPNGSPSSFSFNDSDCDSSCAVAGGGSRLCFKTRELSDYAGKQFLNLYKEFIV